MSLMDTLTNIKELCISIQSYLINLTDLIGNQVSLSGSLVDLHGYDLESMQVLTTVMNKQFSDLIEYVQELRFLILLLLGMCFISCFVFFVYFLFKRKDDLTDLVLKLIRKSGDDVSKPD